MEKLYEVIIVEGKDDKSKIKTYFDAIVIEVGGLGLRKDALKTLDSLMPHLDFIGFFDPDGAGKKIAKNLKVRYPKLRIARLGAKDSRSKNRKKIGVAYASEEILKESLYQAGASVLYREYDVDCIRLRDFSLKNKDLGLNNKTLVALAKRKGEILWTSKQD